MDRISTYYWPEEQQCFNRDIYTYVVEVPVKDHGLPEVIGAKAAQFRNLEDYETFEEVPDNGQDIIGARWVIVRKENHDGLKQDCKARIVAKGFQELKAPKSDSPTTMRESFKPFLQVICQEGFDEFASIDIKAAFLNSKLERNVYVEPPKDLRKPGILWLLHKHLYGLNDASRGFWKLIRKLFGE